MNGIFIHKLKTDPEYYRGLESGDKTFEIRYNDRAFQKGDLLHLQPWDKGSYVEPYKGLIFQITYVCTYQQKEGWVVLGIKPVDKDGADVLRGLKS